MTHHIWNKSSTLNYWSSTCILLRRRSFCCWNTSQLVKTSGRKCSGSFRLGKLRRKKLGWGRGMVMWRGGFRSVRRYLRVGSTGTTRAKSMWETSSPPSCSTIRSRNCLSRLRTHTMKLPASECSSPNGTNPLVARSQALIKPKISSNSSDQSLKSRSLACTCSTWSFWSKGREFSAPRNATIPDLRGI